MQRITREDVVRTVGDVDDAVIAEIIGTGANIEELAEAQAWINNDEPLVNAGRALPSGRIGALVDILDEIEASDDDREEKIVGAAN
jgi:hypothetical protein